MPDPLDLVAIAERFRVQKGIDWKTMALESLLAVPYDYFRKTLGERGIKAGQACYCAFQSVQGAHTFSLSFTVADGGNGIVSFESKGAAGAGGVESLLGAVDGEVTLEFEGLSLSRTEAERMGFKTVKAAGLLSNYLQLERLYAEHVPAEPGESDHERILRGHFYKQPAGKFGWKTVPIPLRSLLPLQSREQELFAQASTITVREQHFLGNDWANPSFWSTLTLAKRGIASEASEISGFHEFHYALAPVGSVPMQPHYQQRPQAVFEALKKVVPADKIFMLEVKTV